MYSIHFRRLPQDAVNVYEVTYSPLLMMEEASITDISWQLAFRWLQVTVAESAPKAHIMCTITCDSSQKEVSIHHEMKILFHKNCQGFCLLLSWPLAKHEAFPMLSHTWNCYFPVENMSTFIQKGICVHEMENNWMKTPCYVGNSIRCLFSPWVRATCTIPGCFVSEEKYFIFMEIFWLSWKLVLGNCLCRRGQR